MDEYITQREHEEVIKRLEEENHRQNKRLDLLEENARQIQALTVSVEKMAVSIENMVLEQRKQGERLKDLEGEPKKSWGTVKTAILSAVGTAIGAGIIAWLVNILK